MRKKVNLDQRLRRVFLVGGIMGAIAGILFTVFVANIIITRKETDFESQNAKLTQEKEDLKLQLNKYNAAHNNSEILSGEDGWALALVNEAHPLDTSYAPAELYEVENNNGNIVITEIVYYVSYSFDASGNYFLNYHYGFDKDSPIISTSKDNMFNKEKFLKYKYVFNKDSSNNYYLTRIEKL